MTSDEILSGGQAVQDITSAILLAAGKALTLHGNDPNSLAILTAAFVMAIRRIEENVEPSFGLRLSAQLVCQS